MFHTSRSHATLLLKLMLVFALLLLPFAAVVSSARADDQTPQPDPNQREVKILKQEVVGNQVLTTVTIPAAQATFIASNQPSNNFGNQSFLGMGYSSDPNYGAMRILIQFNFSSIPAGATINSATFQIYQYLWRGATGFNFFQASQSWSESNATWNNANNIGVNPPSGPFNLSSQLGWKYADATNLVRGWYSNPSSNRGFLVQGQEGPSLNQSVWFYSNYPPQQGLFPQMVVQYTTQTQCDTLPPVVTVNQLPPFVPSSFTVSWSGFDQAPSGCNPSGIANYTVDYQLNNGSFVRWLDRTTATSAAFLSASVGAVNGTIIGFRARGCDNAGNCQPVGNAQTQTTVDTLGPATTMSPLPSQTNSSNFLIHWSGNDYGMSGVRNYNVQQSLNGGPWTTLLQQTTQTDFQIVGAQNGQKYQFRAQATDNVGNVGNWSPVVGTTIFINPFALLEPIVPRIIKPTAPVTSTINLAWTGKTPAGTNITSYMVFFKYNNAPNWTAVQAAQLPGGNTGTFAFNWKQRGLGDGPYVFKVVATNNTGAQTPANFPYGTASVIVDMANKFNFTIFMPLLSLNASP